MRKISNNITFVNDAAEATVVTCEGAFHGEVMAIAILSYLGGVRIMRANRPQDIIKASEHGAVICAVGNRAMITASSDMSTKNARTDRTMHLQGSYGENMVRKSAVT